MRTFIPLFGWLIVLGLMVPPRGQGAEPPVPANASAPVRLSVEKSQPTTLVIKSAPEPAPAAPPTSSAEPAKLNLGDESIAEPQVESSLFDDENNAAETMDDESGECDSNLSESDQFLPHPIDEIAQAPRKRTAQRKIPRLVEQPAADVDVDDSQVELAAANLPLEVPPQIPGVEPARFKEIQPGVTTREELRATWGTPKELRKLDRGQDLIYRIEPFDHVQVRVLDEKVQAIVIALSKPVAPAWLSEQLDVAGFEPVEVKNEAGQALGLAYPERGVMLGYAGGAVNGSVINVMIEPIDVEMFVHRAEQHWHQKPSASLHDTEIALRLSPHNTRALLVRSRLLLQSGRLDEARQAAQLLCKQTAQQREHRLLLAEIELAAEDHGACVALVSKLAEDRAATPLVRATAQSLWGDALAQAPNPQYGTAIQHHQLAVQLAEPLAKSEEPDARRLAMELLAKASLGCAYDIGWGRWQMKEKVVPQWIARAQKVSDESVAHHGSEAEFRLWVGRKGLVAWRGMRPPADCTKLIESTTKVGNELITQTKDPLRRQMLAWELGQALAAATDIVAARNRPEEAQQLGELASRYLDEATPVSQQLPLHDWIVGKLYYRLGALQATQRQDHAQAVSCFNRALPLLECPPPSSSQYDPAELGEVFVAMAVSYWQQSAQQEAVRITRQGLTLMEESVRQQRLEPASLAVPFANLANMCEALGQTTQAQQYTELAQRYQDRNRR